MQVEITFSITGRIIQTVELPDDFDISTLADRLKRGEVITTIQEGYPLVLSGGPRVLVVGKVIDVDQECTYRDFKVEVDDESDVEPLPREF